MRTPPDGKLKQLQRACDRTLRDYMKVCRGGQALLRAIDHIPIPEAQRQRILANRRKEVDAHTAYTSARTKLWKLVTMGEPDGPQTTEPESSVLRSEGTSSG